MNGETRNAANGGAGISMRIVATTGAERFVGYRTYTTSGSPKWAKAKNAR
jgi:hypothetical protein